MGKLVLKELLTASYLGSNRLVPFYYQPTLGGTDIEGVEPFVAWLITGCAQAIASCCKWSFTTTFRGPIGLYGFYDLGKVALNPGDLDFTHLRHDVGVGV
jgi:hypothetical protein